MTTYVYETIPTKLGSKCRHYEIRQGMNDAPLTKRPETGEPIRRVVLGGKAGGACGCGKDGCCR